jgi:hypothetical protein
MNSIDGDGNRVHKQNSGTYNPNEDTLMPTIHENDQGESQIQYLPEHDRDLREMSSSSGILPQ